MHLALLVQEDDFQSTLTEPEIRPCRHQSRKGVVHEHMAFRVNGRGGVDPGTLSSFQLSLELESLLPRAPLRGDPR